MRKYVDESTVFAVNQRSGSVYFSIAEKVIKYAEQMKLPEDKRDADFKADKLVATINAIYPATIDEELQSKLVRAQINVFAEY